MPLKTPKVVYDLIKLAGGLDQVTPTLSLPPGYIRRAANFECSITGGYTRIAGYERFDGRPNPSDALYNVLTCTLSSAVVVGDSVNGATSSATGKVIAVSGLNLVLTRETGTFQSGETLRIGATPVGTIVVVAGVAPDGLEDAQYQGLAADDYRADIAVVPGSGPIRGVAYYNSTVYAWRDNAGGTALGLYKPTASGWTAVTLGKQLSFNTGTAEIFEGQTVTGATSGATGVVARVAQEDGTWAAGDASGRLILSSSTGTFSAGENLLVSAGIKAKSGGAATQITLAPGGRVQTVVANFGGGAGNTRMYGCDGVNRAFEFDGTTYVPIATTMAVDVPTQVNVHKQHLFLAFGSSLQFSALGYPYQWSPLLGAGELAMNGTITNLLTLPGDQASGAMGVYTRNDTSVLYGTGSANFQLAQFNSGTGALPYTAQNLDQAYVLDDRGVVSLGTSLNFGNFLPSAITMNIRPFIQIRRNLATGSIVNREKGQYRIFFSDTYGLYLTLLNGKMLGAMPVQFPHPVLCCVEGEADDGTSVSYFGSDNGFVYRLDAGTSFDGEAIPANMTLTYNSMRSPRLLKRFRHASVELTGDSYASFDFSCDLSYRSTTLSQDADTSYSQDLRSAYWDSLQWDNFIFDGSDVSPSEVDISGTAENMAIRISSVSAILQPFTVNTIIVHYTIRRGLR